MKTNRSIEWICVLACLMDAGTGMMLIALPAFTLTMMGLDPAGEPLAYLRFIGAFVFAIGTLYGLGWRYLKSGRVVEWGVVWIATAWARLCVGTTVLGLIVSGGLSVAWISVPIADLGLGLFQFWYLARIKRADA